MTHLTGLVLILAAISQNAAAQTPPPVTPMTPDVVDKYEQTLPAADFIRREAMIPMRDGVKLYTVIVMKKGTTNAPILLSRTPYDAHKSTHRVASQRIVDILEVMDAEFVNDGYIRVYQDIRGLHSSEGAVRDEPADRRAAEQHRHRRVDRRLRHHRLAGEERAGVERQGRHHRLVLSRLHHAHGRDQSAPGAEGRRAAEPDGRRLDGRRLVPQRRVPRQRSRLRRRADHQQGRR